MFGSASSGMKSFCILAPWRFSIIEDYWNQRKARLFFLEPRRVLEEYGIRRARYTYFLHSGRGRLVKNKVFDFFR
jgi:hypothetical protein